eukprot:TRINITY_DN6564_c0_g1_i1.p1 TRINITY_DN6564_c0_g1~~TRINITY_DN6564_c0_g1_i1.p1  ORF type:complete len:631 (+),score=286.82 TRINITY_DN6564_c0_g1_i1:65-1957(+)
MPRIRTKKRSKRNLKTLKHQFKVKKKVKEHHKKLRRDARRNPDARKKLKKDPGIPNLWPYKEEMLQKLKKQKENKELEEERKKQLIKQLRKERKANKVALAELVEDAQKRATEYENQKEKREKGFDFNKIPDLSKRQFYKEFKKVVESSDVILEVLDARDPIGCRCFTAENKILTQDPTKKIILILNKIDLVPKEVVSEWLKYLRNEYPAVAFKCNTQQQRNKLGQSSVSVENASSSLLQTNECLGANTLISLLKNYCRSIDMKTSITVGIIGFPNVGKSSLINSLKRSRAAGVGATPGHTKIMQEIILDKNIKLLDCPGIVFASGGDEGKNLLRNCVKIENIEDPVKPVEEILNRCAHDQILSLYKIPQFSSTMEFLSHVARKRGKISKGGIPNYEEAAILILRDWNFGKISFYSLPPKNSHQISASSVVKEWAEAFDINAVFGEEEKAVISNLTSFDDMVDNGNLLSIESSLPDEEDDLIDSEFIQHVESLNFNESSNNNNNNSNNEMTYVSNFDEYDEDYDEDEELGHKINVKLTTVEDQYNPQTNLSKKKQFKRLQKEKKRKKKLQEQLLLQQLDENMLDEDEQFDEDFDFQNDFIADDDINGMDDLSDDDDDDDDDDDIDDDDLF